MLNIAGERGGGATAAAADGDDEFRAELERAIPSLRRRETCSATACALLETAAVRSAETPLVRDAHPRVNGRRNGERGGRAAARESPHAGASDGTDGHAPVDAAGRVARVLAEYMCAPSRAVSERLIELLQLVYRPVHVIPYVAHIVSGACADVERVVAAYVELLHADRGLLVPIVASLGDLPLSIDARRAVRRMTAHALGTVDEHDVPTVVRAMARFVSSAARDERRIDGGGGGSVADGAWAVALIRRATRDVSPGTLALVVEVLADATRVNPELAQRFVRESRRRGRGRPRTAATSTTSAPTPAVCGPLRGEIGEDDGRNERNADDRNYTVKNAAPATGVASSSSSVSSSVFALPAARSHAPLSMHHRTDGVADSIASVLPIDLCMWCALLTRPRDRDGAAAAVRGALQRGLLTPSSLRAFLPACAAAVEPYGGGAVRLWKVVLDARTFMPPASPLIVASYVPPTHRGTAAAAADATVKQLTLSTFVSVTAARGDIVGELAARCFGCGHTRCAAVDDWWRGSAVHGAVDDTRVCDMRTSVALLRALADSVPSEVSAHAHLLEERMHDAEHVPMCSDDERAYESDLAHVLSALGEHHTAIIASTAMTVRKRNLFGATLAEQLSAHSLARALMMCRAPVFGTDDKRDMLGAVVRVVNPGATDDALVAATLSTLRAAAPILTPDAALALMRETLIPAVPSATALTRVGDCDDGLRIDVAQFVGRSFAVAAAAVPAWSALWQQTAPGAAHDALRVSVDKPPALQTLIDASTQVQAGAGSGRGGGGGGRQSEAPAVRAVTELDASQIGTALDAAMHARAVLACVMDGARSVSRQMAALARDLDATERGIAVGMLCLALRSTSSDVKRALLVDWYRRAPAPSIRTRLLMLMSCCPASGDGVESPPPENDASVDNDRGCTLHYASFMASHLRVVLDALEGAQRDENELEAPVDTAFVQWLAHHLVRALQQSGASDRLIDDSRGGTGDGGDSVLAAAVSVASAHASHQLLSVLLRLSCVLFQRTVPRAPVNGESDAALIAQLRAFGDASGAVRNAVSSTRHSVIAALCLDVLSMLAHAAAPLPASSAVRTATRDIDEMWLKALSREYPGDAGSDAGALQQAGGASALTAAFLFSSSSPPPSTPPVVTCRRDQTAGAAVSAQSLSARRPFAVERHMLASWLATLPTDRAVDEAGVLVHMAEQLCRQSARSARDADLPCLTAASTPHLLACVLDVAATALTDRWFNAMPARAQIPAARARVALVRGLLQVLPRCAGAGDHNGAVLEQVMRVTGGVLASLRSRILNVIRVMTHRDNDAGNEADDSAAVRADAAAALRAFHALAREVLALCESIKRLDPTPQSALLGAVRRVSSSAANASSALGDGRRGAHGGGGRARSLRRGRPRGRPRTRPRGGGATGRGAGGVTSSALQIEGSAEVKNSDGGGRGPFAAGAGSAEYDNGVARDTTAAAAGGATRDDDGVSLSLDDDARFGGNDSDGGRSGAGECNADAVRLPHTIRAVSLSAWRRMTRLAPKVGVAADTVMYQVDDACRVHHLDRNAAHDDWPVSERCDALPSRRAQYASALDDARSGSCDAGDGSARGALSHGNGALDGSSADDEVGVSEGDVEIEDETWTSEEEKEYSEDDDDDDNNEYGEHNSSARGTMNRAFGSVISGCGVYDAESEQARFRVRRRRRRAAAAPAAARANGDAVDNSGGEGAAGNDGSDADDADDDNGGDGGGGGDDDDDDDDRGYETMVLRFA